MADKKNSSKKLDKKDHAKTSNAATAVKGLVTGAVAAVSIMLGLKHIGGITKIIPRIFKKS